MALSFWGGDSQLLMASVPPTTSSSPLVSTSQVTFLPSISLSSITSSPPSNSQSQKNLVFPVSVSIELRLLRLDEISKTLGGFSGTIQLKTTWKDSSYSFDKKQEG
jgi:hypothetical protein